jgi:CelD/BcsL family acetyltransferase involved in cellulose biosynthesis
MGRHRHDARPFLYVHAKFATLRYGGRHDAERSFTMNAPMAISGTTNARDFAPFLVAPVTPDATLWTISQLRADAALLAEWHALVADASEPNPFAEPWYVMAALAALETDHVSVIVVRDHALLGIMPIVPQQRYAGLSLPHVQNWLNHNAFLGTPLARKGTEHPFWKAVLRHFDDEPDSGLFLHLNALTADGPVVAALRDVCQTEKRRFAMVHCEERALLERGLSPDAYWEANVRGKKRKELRRQHKRLAEKGTLSFERSDGSVGLDRWIDDFLALEMAGWKGQNGSALDCADDTRALFRAALRGAAAAGKLELLAHYLDGRPIAMLVNFLTPPAAFSFKTAFDENFARYSPGVLLQFENLALLERDGIDYCDSCAAQDHPMIDSLWSGRRMIGRYSVAIGGKAKRAAFAALLTAEKTKAKFKGRTKT